MKLSATRLFPLALVAALALLSFWLEQAGRVDAPHPSLRRHDPDYVIDNLLIQNFDAAGRAVSTLSAAKMVHYPDDDSTELALPRVVDQKLNKPRMTLRADRGTMNQAGDEVFLYDNVLLVREATAEVPEARVQTSFIHIVRPRSLVRTDREVSITEDNRSIVGRGLEYDNETRETRMYSDVRARFEPKKAP
jgi:lipopolysaccharide export system protein LptC